LKEQSVVKENLLQVRWPKVLGLEQIFQDMEIEEEPAFLNIQESRARTDDTVEIDNRGNNITLLILDRC